MRGKTRLKAHGFSSDLPVVASVQMSSEDLERHVRVQLVPLLNSAALEQCYYAIPRALESARSCTARPSCVNGLG